MIGIDTTVLLRHTLEDDAAQSPLATAFLTDEERLDNPALVNPVALIEFCWTLARRQKFSKPDILALLDVLSSSKRIAFTDDGAMRAAIESWRVGKADLQDYLIGYLNQQAGAAETVTFDEKAADEPFFSLLRA